MKKIYFSILALSICSFAFSQRVVHGLGITVVTQSATNYTADPVGAITYSPRISFMETESSSLSIGIPFSFGVSGSYNTNDYYGENHLGIMLDAPLLFNYNYGAGSSRESEDKWGFFAGAGFGYHMNQLIATDNNGNDYSSKMAGFGPAGDAGVRMAVGQRGHNLELRGSYMKTLDITKSGILSVGILFNF